MGASFNKMAGRLYMRFMSLDSTFVRGLSNSSLSCCVNALLQSFCATTELMEILNKWHPSEEIGVNNIPLKLKNTLQAMRDSSNRAPHSDLLDCLHHHSIRRYSQQDADEIFHIILHLSQRQMPEEDRYLAQEIRSLYDIKVETQLMCLECAYIQKVPHSLFSLPLAIHEKDNTLESCIQSFFLPQDLKDEDEVYCERCAKKRPTTHAFNLVSLPPVLCVNLKRFRKDGLFTRKLYDKVTFPELLNTDIFTAASKLETGKVGQYSLYAVIVHSGSAVSGHYTAYIKSSQDQMWYYADDSNVQTATWADVQSTYGGRETAYLLLYRRVN